MAMAQQPADVHEWFSFDDPDEERTWVIDLTFLRSNWACVYGAGCLGVHDVPTPELAQGCCTHGAHFIDHHDITTVVAAAKHLTAEGWQYFEEGHGLAVSGQPAWLDGDDEAGFTTRVVDGACIFLNRPDFHGGAGCALHARALATGERPIDVKPAVCWQLPLRLVEHVDEHGHVTSTLREWKRRDWGPAGADFHWWCTDDALAFAAHQPVYRTMRDELVEFMGERAYAMVVAFCEQPRPVPLPHPALRRL
jgi:hypothetical protein